MQWPYYNYMEKPSPKIYKHTAKVYLPDYMLLTKLLLSCDEGKINQKHTAQNIVTTQVII